MGKKTGRPPGRPRFEPTDEQRRYVESMAGYGMPQEKIARVLKISKPTLLRAFRDELDIGIIKADAKVVESLYNNAVKHNNASSQIWWTKCRLGWKETTAHEHSGPNGKPIETDNAVRFYLPDNGRYKRD